MATFYDMFIQCAERWPENTALEIQRRDDVASFTLAQSRRMAESIGRWLRDQRSNPGRASLYWPQTIHGGSPPIWDRSPQAAPRFLSIPLSMPTKSQNF